MGISTAVRALLRSALDGLLFGEVRDIPAGKVVRMFGEEGRGPGQFIYPVAIAKDAQENLFVCEYGSNDRVQKFTRHGKFLLAFGSFGTGEGQFQRPSGIVWHDGKVFVADAFNNRIQEFTDAGQYVRTLGPVALNFPYDLRRTEDGSFYVIEYGAARLTKIDPDGLSTRTISRVAAINASTNSAGVASAPS